jgi:hypothetical protein
MLIVDRCGLHLEEGLKVEYYPKVTHQNPSTFVLIHCICSWPQTPMASSYWDDSWFLHNVTSLAITSSDYHTKKPWAL